jgi:cobalt-zinc-cadmium efflux system outer membrane protein
MRSCIFSKAISIAVALSFLAATASDAGSNTGELTLDDALRAALAANPRLLSARQAVEGATGRAEQARAWPNPELSFSAEDVPRDGALSDGTNLVGVSQTVPFPFKKTFAGRAGRSEVDATRTDYDLAAISLERDVKIAFYRALAAEQGLAISGELAEAAGDLAEAARRRVESGVAPLQEQLRAEIELERARSDVVARERDRDVARESLFILMGEVPREATLVGDLSVDTTLVGSTTPNGAAEYRHPLLAGADARRERAEHELKRAKLEPLPDLGLRFAAGRDEGGNDVMEMEAAISIPLFDLGGGLRREKRAELETARADLAATTRDFAAARRTAFETFRAAADQASAYRDRILPRAERALDLVREGFEAGKFGFIDLLDTQRTLQEARLVYIERLFDLNSARAEWEALNTTSPRISSKE